MNDIAQQRAAAGTSRMNMQGLFQLMVDKAASDLFLTPGAPAKIKIAGRIKPVNKTIMSAEMVRSAAHSIMTQEQIQQLHDAMEIDFAVSRDGLGRFRVNAFHQRGSVAMVMRYICSDVPTLDGLKMPEVLKTLIMHKRGLILMVGATGSGKSTTLAAMVNERNEKISNHILTIEDPIEFLHRNKKSIVNQREVGHDTASYARALKSAMREAPDVILIGEIRDRETMEAALHMAGTGHLTISTLHSNNSAETLDRIINMFPQDQHKQVLMDLSHYLRAIISQRLVEAKDGGRVAALEIMLNTPHISELILKGQVGDVKEAMTDSGQAGMQDFDTSLFNLFKEGRVELEEALRNADSRTNLEARINFG